MKNAIIIGASSGIGRALAKVLASSGYSVGLASRRGDLLREVADEIHVTSFVKVIDVSKPAEAMQSLRELIAEMKELQKKLEALSEELKQQSAAAASPEKK